MAPGLVSRSVQYTLNPKLSNLGTPVPGNLATKENPALKTARARNLSLAFSQVAGGDNIRVDRGPKQLGYEP